MQESSRNRRLALSLAALALGMAMLAYASVPLYRLFCAVTGFGGTTQTAQVAPSKISNRMITIRFNADTDTRLAWRFRPSQKQMQVYVGERSLASYTAENLTEKALKGHATYNVTPHKVGAYFDKIHCFCFEEQMLGPHQKVDMPVSFFINPKILEDPAMRDVDTITLSYTFFPVKQNSR